MTCRDLGQGEEEPWRDGKWQQSAIYGNWQRGSGILNNELYRGFASLDDLIGSEKQARRNSEAQRLCGSEVDRRFEPGWRLHRKIGGLIPAQDPIDVGRAVDAGRGAKLKTCGVAECRPTEAQSSTRDAARGTGAGTGTITPLQTPKPTEAKPASSEPPEMEFYQDGTHYALRPAQSRATSTAGSTASVRNDRRYV